MERDVRFGCQVVSYGDEQATVDRAVAADRAGFDAVSLPDHLFHPTGTEEYLTDPPWEAYTVLGAIAAETERATLMPGVADSVRRHPTLLAHATATLDRLSGGRAALGLGAGEAFNLAPVAEFDVAKPYTRFRETLAVVDGLWRSTPDDPLTFRGEFFELSDAHMGLEPASDPRPPVYVGGYGPKMRTLTGREADGWLPWIYDAASYATDLERVLDAAEEAGRDPDDVTRSVMLPTAVSEDGAAAERAALDRSRVNLALRPAILANLGYPELAEAAPVMREMAYGDEQRERLGEVAAQIPDDAVREIVIAGTPEQAIEQIEAFVEAGVDFPILVPVGEFETTVDHYAETIVPAFS